MQFIKDNTDGVNIVTGLDEQAIRINDQLYHQSVVIQARHIRAWNIDNVASLDDAAWEAIINNTPDNTPEVLLLGTGKQLMFPSNAQLSFIYERNIGIEVMDSEAACRTYNLLVHEGRKVTAAIIL